MPNTASFGGSETALLDAAEQYLDRIADKRTGSISACKSFDAYRARVTIESGHYDAIQLPDGTLRKHPRSIAFANMDETEFQQLYKAALDVLWRWILSKAFRDQREAENAAAQLMSFAGDGMKKTRFHHTDCTTQQSEELIAEYQRRGVKVERNLNSDYLTDRQRPAA